MPVGSVPTSSVPPARKKSTSSFASFGKSCREDRRRVAIDRRLAPQELVAEDRIEHVEPRRHRTSRRERLEHRERRRQGDLSVDEMAHERPHRVAGRIDRGEGLERDALIWTDVGLLVRDEIRRREEAVLEVVDSEVRRLAIRDRAQMTSDFQASLVALLESRAQFVAREVHVRFERRRADPCPIRDRAVRASAASLST